MAPMPTDRLFRCAALALLAGALAPAARCEPAPTMPTPDHEQARQALQQGRVLALRQVLDGVERDFGGQVLKVEFESEDGHFIYEIRLLQSDGHLVKLKVDAVDGQVLEVRRKPGVIERRDDAHFGHRR